MQRCAAGVPVRGAHLERVEEVRERRVVVTCEGEHLLLAPAAHRGWHAAFAHAKGAVGRGRGAVEQLREVEAHAALELWRVADDEVDCRVALVPRL